MWPAALKVTLLNSFDNALLEAGIGNVNLVRISSILPPGGIRPDMVIPGSLVPTAYGYVISEKPGEKIAACVGIGFSSDTFGVIMEYAGKGSKEDAEAKIKAMESAFAARNMPLVDVKLAPPSMSSKTGCAFAAVALY